MTKRRLTKTSKKKLAWMHLYYIANREKLLAYAKEYRRINHDPAVSRMYYVANRAKFLEASRRHYWKHKDSQAQLKT